jgi:CrcB protein
MADDSYWIASRRKFMEKVLIVGLGSFLGGIARYGLSALLHKHLGTAFPYGTLAVNALGCLLIGGVLHLVEDRSMLGPEARLFVAIGVLGGFTTFSTFGYETMQLMKDHAFGLAFLNVAGNVLLGLAAVWAGRGLFRLVGV